MTETKAESQTVSGKSPVRKVIGATVGAGLSVPTADFVNWAADQAFFSPDAYPPQVSLFLSALITTVFAFTGGYFVKRAAGE